MRQRARLAYHRPKSGATKPAAGEKAGKKNDYSGWAGAAEAVYASSPSRL